MVYENLYHVDMNEYYNQRYQDINGLNILKIVL